MLTKTQIDDIFNFWFPNQNYNKFWFNGEFDNIIKNKYNNLLQEVYLQIKTINFSEMSSDELVAIIILLDQFSRNINRVLYDDNINNNILLKLDDCIIHDMTEEASKLSKYWIKKEYYLTEPINKVVFALMPLRHLNKISDYNLILNILDKIEDKNNEIYIKFKNKTITICNLLKN